MSKIKFCSSDTVIFFSIFSLFYFDFIPFRSTLRAIFASLFVRKINNQVCEDTSTLTIVTTATTGGWVYVWQYQRGRHFGFRRNLLGANSYPIVRRSRLPHRDRNFAESYENVKGIISKTNCAYAELDFEGRFRIPKSIFERLEHTISGQDLFKTRKDATGRSHIHPKPRLICALHLKTYGIGSD